VIVTKCRSGGEIKNMLRGVAGKKATCEMFMWEKPKDMPISKSHANVSLTMM
jgi:hypothetical protein